MENRGFKILHFMSAALVVALVVLANVVIKVTTAYRSHFFLVRLYFRMTSRRLRIANVHNYGQNFAVKAMHKMRGPQNMILTRHFYL